MGHEFCCEVIELGPGCDNLKVGDVVVSMPVTFDAAGLHAVGFSNSYNGGYAELKSVITKEKSDRTETYFFGETLKYLYLLFAPPETLDFDNVIFNTEAHPIRRTW